MNYGNIDSAEASGLAGSGGRFSSGRLQPEEVGLDEIYRMMISDGNVPNTVIFKHQFSSPDPSRVTLTLRNERQELMATTRSKG